MAKSTQTFYQHTLYYYPTLISPLSSLFPSEPIKNTKNNKSIQEESNILSQEILINCLSDLSGIANLHNSDMCADSDYLHPMLKKWSTPLSDLKKMESENKWGTNFFEYNFIPIKKPYTRIWHITKQYLTHLLPYLSISFNNMAYSRAQIPNSEESTLEIKTISLNLMEFSTLLKAYGEIGFSINSLLNNNISIQDLSNENAMKELNEVNEFTQIADSFYALTQYGAEQTKHLVQPYEDALLNCFNTQMNNLNQHHIPIQQFAKCMWSLAYSQKWNGELFSAALNTFLQIPIQSLKLDFQYQDLLLLKDVMYSVKHESNNQQLIQIIQNTPILNVIIFLFHFL